jgi:transposase-like protein
LSDQGGCPHCGHAEVVKFGTTDGTQRYRCKGCGKTFTATTGTPFHRLRDKTKLLENAACLADGLSIRKTAQRLGFSVDKTFRWRHRFLQFLSLQQPSALTGVVEADETLFARSTRGRVKDCRVRRKNGRGRPKKAGAPTRY